MSRRPRLALALGALAFLIVASPDADAAPKKKKGKARRTPAVAAAVSAPAAAASEGPAFDREAASLALSSVDLTKCRVPNAEVGDGHVKVTFSPQGDAQAAAVDKGPWVGGQVATCLAMQFRKAKIPAFVGGAVTVGKSFHFE